MLFFQPVMPVPVGKDMILITRPVFPLVTNVDPVLSGTDVAFQHKTGLGNIQLFTAVAPKRRDGLICRGVLLTQLTYWLSVASDFVPTIPG